MKYYVYGEQTTSFRAVVDADSKEEAAQKGIDLEDGWDEIGELNWTDLPNETEYIGESEPTTKG